MPNLGRGRRGAAPSLRQNMSEPDKHEGESMLIDQSPIVFEHKYNKFSRRVRPLNGKYEPHQGNRERARRRKRADRHHEKQSEPPT